MDVLNHAVLIMLDSLLWSTHLAEDSRLDLARMTADVVAAYVRNNKLSADQISEAIRSVHRSLVDLSGNEANHTALIPAVPVRKSVTPDYIVCLEDGRRLKMLKRHLRNAFGLSPDQYRAKWGLPADYPIVAPSYAAKRSALAKKIGLGRDGGKKRRSKR